MNEIDNKFLYPKISIVIPVYNVEKFLQDCIDSLVSQTILKKGNELELIFVNDASTDNCLQILEKNKKIYPNLIKVINLLKNVRQGGARNIGIKNAKSEYVGFVDSDDFCDKSMFELLYDEILKDNYDAVYIDNVQVNESSNLKKFNIISKQLCTGGVWSGIYKNKF